MKQAVLDQQQNGVGVAAAEGVGGSRSNLAVEMPHKNSIDDSHSFFRHLKLCKMLFIITFVYLLSFLPTAVYGFLVAFRVAPFNIYIYKGYTASLKPSQ